jgi:hypothetical protein
MALTLAAARRAVEAERRETVVERDGFRRFRAAVARADAEPSRAPGAPAPTPGVDAGVTRARMVTTVQTPASGPPNSPLARAYQQSVMAAGADTGESVAEHLAAELGPDAAQTVCAGSLTPERRRALVDRVDVALDARDSFVSLLDRERESLDAVETACRRVRSELGRVRSWEAAVSGDGPAERDVPVEAALSAWDRLDDLTAALDEAAAERQATLARHRRSFAVVDDDATGYLYGERPGLAAVASLGHDVAAARRAVTAAVGCLEAR